MIHRRYDMKKSTDGSVQDEFQRGIEDGINPSDDSARSSDGRTITTLHSHWLHARCPVCSHTFRLGDEVHIAEDGTVRHCSVLLACSQRLDSAQQASHETAEFFRGLDEAWPRPDDVPIFRLEAGHELLAPPREGFRRRTCVVCGHTFRLHDEVVICPCSPNDPLCSAAVHRDVMNGLHCYEAWNPAANRQHYCPVTSRKLDV
jgi:hypothetical protein